MGIWFEGVVPKTKESQVDSTRRWPLPSAKRINYNAYKVDLLSDYQVHNTFKICDLSPLNVLTMII